MDALNRKSTPSSGTAYRFGLFSLSASTRSLTRNGILIRLQDQPFQLLVLLLEKRGEIVTRDEIRQRLWPGNTFVDFDKSLGVAVVKVREALADSAANPRFLETVPRRGYRFIAPVSVEVLPSGSPEDLNTGQTDAPVIEALPVQSMNPPPQASPVVKRGLAITFRQIVWLAAGVLCLALALIFIAVRLHLGTQRAATPLPAAPLPLKVRRSVAVLGFRNLAAQPEHNWLSTAFTEMLNTELAANGDLRLISGEDVANAKHDLSWQDTLAKNTLARLRSNLGADVVVVGSYTLLRDGAKNRIRLDIRAQDTALGETVYEGAITGNESDLFDIAAQAGSRIREGINPSPNLSHPREAPRFYGSTNQLAVQFFSEGRARLYEFDFVGARDLLKRAVNADPNFALAHSSLARAWGGMGYEAQEREEAKRALELTRNLPPEAALAIQGQYQQSVSDWQGALQTYQKLFGLFPDNLTYGLQLAEIQNRINPADAVRTLAALRTLPAPVGSDPRIDLMEASVLIARNLPKARAAAQRAIAKASAQGAPLMMARGYGILCQQNPSVGASMDQSVAECDLARNSYISAGDRNNAARTLNDLAALYFQHGDLDQAESMWREAIEVFRKVGDTEGIAASSNNVGDVLLTRGKLAEARELLQQAIAGYKLVGDRSGTALAMVDLGEIALQGANLPIAKANYEQALAIGTQTGDKSVAAYGLFGLGEVLMAQDQLTAARGQYEMARKLRKDIGEKQAILQTRVALARLAIEEGHPKDAESEARECRNQFHQDQLIDDELSAGLVLVGALLDESKDGQAKQEMVALRHLDEKTGSREMQLRFSIEFARILLAEHDLPASRILLDKASKQAEASGFSSLQWEAQIVRARVQLEAGDLAGATKQLNALKARARTAGLLLLARKAGPNPESGTNFSN
jgi:DNA-binding winged helix-turn-helix (wHTH) protein/tetratricopeptide (TPR) repeat protein